MNHFVSNVDYTYNFNMERFSTIDHLLVSNLLFDTCIQHGSVLHDNDNTSDHDPILLCLALNTEHINVTNRVHVSRASWHKASDNDLAYYKQVLSFNLNFVVLPIDCLLCHSLQYSVKILIIKWHCLDMLRILLMLALKLATSVFPGLVYTVKIIFVHLAGLSM